ncbi:DUF5133 domain-containing protein [Streptomyces sp. H27-H1]|uniref:DUF5133 domain-containing protein n=1 Tax=Streptomyces sp. H27-H1 TaxID=2996461 RepID=UPI0022711C5E|nr:DUF5133 domain-containing protein [Streptomyces sp. H27-H1]MCY0932250.1 DUF5133 domain-containing protein [Streptomyces sp. H27-H1]
MDEAPARNRPLDTPLPPSTGAPEPNAIHAAVGRATGILMALVPCSADSARQILAGVAQSTGARVEDVADAALALHTDCDLPGSLTQALRRSIDATLTARPLRTSDSARGRGVRPEPRLLREHLSHFRAMRRRTFAALDDACLRSELENASYTLCVLMGERSTHLALQAAEELIAAHRLLLRSRPSGPDC